MRKLQPQPSLVEQVYEAILSDVSSGKLGSDTRLRQEELAESLGVSRHPVQQALLLLRNHGILRDAPGRGLMVAPLEADFVRNLYEVRAVLDGLAGAKAAERGSEAARKKGAAYIKSGRDAVASRSIAKMIAADMEFHFFLYGLSQNPLIAETSSAHWSYLRRVMGEVLLHGETPGDIWNQHEAILDAVVSGDVNEAERVSREHISLASQTLMERLAERELPDASADDVPRRERKRA